MKSFLAFVLLLFVIHFPVSGQESPIPTPAVATPTPTALNPDFNPTPNWDHWIRGYDYQANVVLVLFNKGISEAEEERLRKKMDSIGKVTFHAWNGKPPISYKLTITNHMTEKQVLDIFNHDPAIRGAELNTVTHNPFGEFNWKGLTPAPTPVPYN